MGALVEGTQDCKAVNTICVSVVSLCRFGKTGYGLSLKRYGPLPIVKVGCLFATGVLRARGNCCHLCLFQQPGGNKCEVCFGLPEFIYGVAPIMYGIACNV